MIDFHFLKPYRRIGEGEMMDAIVCYKRYALGMRKEEDGSVVEDRVSRVIYLDFWIIKAKINWVSSDLRKALSRIWGRILCGRPVRQGNYSRYWGECNEELDIWENDIFEIGWFRSIFVDLIDRGKGQWASHPRANYEM